MSELKQNARLMRKNMTDAEQKLWGFLRGRQIFGEKFRRQAAIGNYIVDFVCFDKKLVVEIDGGQHALRAVYDRQRTNWLCEQGFKVVRFWNHEVLTDIEAVVQRIGELVKTTPSPPPRPSPVKGEGVNRGRG